MNKLIYAKTVHKRFSPTPHEFEYEIPYLLMDIKTLENTAQSLSIFSYNKKNILSLFDQDYLQLGSESIQNKLDQLRKQWGKQAPHATWMLTLPRFFNRVFNPVTFFFDCDEDKNVIAVIAEITNTYKEKHVYYIYQSQNDKLIDHTEKKEFHVSPFLSERGHYHFRIHKSLEFIQIHIEYKENETVFYANLVQTKSQPLTTKNLMKSLLLFPLGILGTLPRIYFQAMQLYYIKKIPAASKPVPHDQNTLRPKPATKGERFMKYLVLKGLSAFQEGQLTLVLPDGSTTVFGNSNGLQATMHIKEYACFSAFVLKGEIGFGESYVDGLWDTPDLNALLALFLKNKAFIKSQVKGVRLFKKLNQWQHNIRKNSILNSKHNIQKHYDLSNALYTLFLDKQLNYSSAYFPTPQTTLETAQEAKLDRLMDSLQLTGKEHVLEIGSGWGACAVRLAKRYGCQVTTLTLSQAQYDYVVELVKAEGLESQVQIRLEDYRLHQGLYDRVISIEMIEAVGHAFLPTYFKAIDRFLKPNGLVAIQAITFPDQDYKTYLSRADWIQKHVFPGAHLPSLKAIQDAICDHTTFLIEKIDNIGPHYALTLAEWRKRFLAQEAHVKALGFDQAFIRKWVYYLTYCEVGFKYRYLNNLQLVLTRSMNKTLMVEDKV